MDSAHGDFEVNQTKIRGGCQSRRKVVPHDSKSDLPLVPSKKISATNDVTSWKDSASMYLMFTMTWGLDTCQLNSFEIQIDCSLGFEIICS